MVSLAGTLIPPPLATVTFVNASETFGSVPAWITANPIETAVTGTETLFAFGGNVTLEGTMATAGLVDVKLIVRPLETPVPARTSIRFCVAPGNKVRFCTKKLIFAHT